MSTTRSISSPAATLENRKSEIFVLKNRKPSSYQKQAYAGEKDPRTGVFMDSTKFTFLSLESFVDLGPDEGRADIMYIKGAPSIFKDDIYVDREGGYHTTMSVSEDDAATKGWKLKKGLVSLKRIDTDAKLAQARAANKKLKVGFEAGILALDKFGNDPNLKKFIELHHQNVNAPNFQVHGNSIFIFGALQEEKIAETQLGNLEAETEVMQIVSSLRTKKDAGFTYSAVNKAKINAILVLLDQKNFAEENYTQKHMAISQYAKINPELFLEIVKDAFDEKKLLIASAMNEAIKVIQHDKKEGTYGLVVAQKDGKSSVRPLIKYSATNTDDQVEELIIHFINNPTNWRDATLLVDAAKGK